MSNSKILFVKQIILAILETIEIQCERKYIADKNSESVDYNNPELRVSGVIGVTSEYFNGSVSLIFTKCAFLDIMEGMLGEEYEEIDDDLIDGCAELLNIAYGTVKKKLNEQGYKIAMAIPTVVHGEKLKFKQAGSDPAVIVPFHREGKSFLVTINFENKNEKELLNA